MTADVPAVPRDFDPKHEYEENPFLNGFSVPVRRKRVQVGETDDVIVNTKTGEVTDIPTVTRYVEVDTDVFVKLFVGQIGVFFSLPNRAMKLAEVLMYEMGRFAGTDMVYLNQAAAERYFRKTGKSGMSKVTYHRALSDMLNAGLIAYSDRPGLFFLNPHVFFNGDRARFVTEYRKKKVREREQLEAAGQQRLDFDNEPPAQNS